MTYPKKNPYITHKTHTAILNPHINCFEFKDSNQFNITFLFHIFHITFYSDWPPINQSKSIQKEVNKTSIVCYCYCSTQGGYLRKLFKYIFLNPKNKIFLRIVYQNIQHKALIHTIKNFACYQQNVVYLGVFNGQFKKQRCGFSSSYYNLQTIIFLILNNQILINPFYTNPFIDSPFWNILQKYTT